MYCEQAEMKLAQYLFDELDEAERIELEAHLEACDTCHEKIGDMRVTIGLLKDGISAQPAPALSEGKRIALFEQLSNANLEASEMESVEALESLAFQHDENTNIADHQTQNDGVTWQFPVSTQARVLLAAAGLAIVAMLTALMLPGGMDGGDESMAFLMSSEPSADRAHYAAKDAAKDGPSSGAKDRYGRIRSMTEYSPDNVAYNSDQPEHYAPIRSLYIEDSPVTGGTNDIDRLHASSTYTGERRGRIVDRDGTSNSRATYGFDNSRTFSRVPTDASKVSGTNGTNEGTWLSATQLADGAEETKKWEHLSNANGVFLKLPSANEPNAPGTLSPDLPDRSVRSDSLRYAQRVPNAPSATAATPAPAARPGYRSNRSTGFALAGESKRASGSGSGPVSGLGTEHDVDGAQDWGKLAPKGEKESLARHKAPIAVGGAIASDYADNVKNFYSATIRDFEKKAQATPQSNSDNGIESRSRTLNQWSGRRDEYAGVRNEKLDTKFNSRFGDTRESINSGKRPALADISGVERGIVDEVTRDSARMFAPTNQLSSTTEAESETATGKDRENGRTQHLFWAAVPDSKHNSKSDWGLAKVPGEKAAANRPTDRHVGPIGSNSDVEARRTEGFFADDLKESPVIPKAELSAKSRKYSYRNSEQGEVPGRYTRNGGRQSESFQRDGRTNGDGNGDGYRPAGIPPAKRGPGGEVHESTVTAPSATLAIRGSDVEFGTKSADFDKKRGSKPDGNTIGDGQEGGWTYQNRSWYDKSGDKGGGKAGETFNGKSYGKHGGPDGSNTQAAIDGFVRDKLKNGQLGLQNNDSAKGKARGGEESDFIRRGALDLVGTKHASDGDEATRLAIVDPKGRPKSDSDTLYDMGVSGRSNEGEGPGQKQAQQHGQGEQPPLSFDLNSARSNTSSGGQSGSKQQNRFEDNLFGQSIERSQPSEPAKDLPPTAGPQANKPGDHSERHIKAIELRHVEPDGVTLSDLMDNNGEPFRPQFAVPAIKGEQTFREEAGKEGREKDSRGVKSRNTPDLTLDAKPGYESFFGKENKLGGNKANANPTNTTTSRLSSELEKHQAVQKLLRKAHENRKSGDHDEALQSVNQALFLDPTNPAGEAMKEMMEDAKIAIRSREFHRERSKRIANKELEETEKSIPYDELLTFPSDWPKLTEAQLAAQTLKDGTVILNGTTRSASANNPTGETKNQIELEAANNELLAARNVIRREVQLNQETIEALKEELELTRNALLSERGSLSTKNQEILRAHLKQLEYAQQAAESASAAPILLAPVVDPTPNTPPAVKQPDQPNPDKPASKEKPSTEDAKKKAAEQEAIKKEESLAPSSNFAIVPVNPWTRTAVDKQSTFALDVDTASYNLARKYIGKGYLPPIGSVRMEEFVNAFDYNYPQKTGQTFTVFAEGAPAPFGPTNQPNVKLLKVGVRGKVIGRDGRKPAHLVFAVDASGSMARPDRLPLVKHSLALLVQQLTPTDKVSLIAYGSDVHVLLDPTPASQKDRIIEAINALQPTGATNLLKGVTAAYRMSEQAYEAGQINRVILCSDGIATLGETEADDILKYVDHYRRQGISFTSVGFGAGTYNDTLMEKLANKGDGTYLYVDSKQEARRVFVDELTATLQTIAKDAKIQVEFNPHRVRRYRLIGYENRAIADKDFRNDTIDAGEVGSGQSSTALYEVELQGDASASIGTVFVRYKNTDTDKVEEISYALGDDVIRDRKPNADPRFYMAACAAEFAELLRQSEHARNGQLGNVQNVMHQVVQQLPLDKKAKELLDLIKRAQSLPRAP